MTLLIVGGESDFNTQRVVDQAHLRDIDYVFWDTDQSDCRNIAWDFDSPRLDLGDKQIVPSAIFLRCNVFGDDPQRDQTVFETIKSYAFTWPKVRILNRHSTDDLNNKSLNLRLAREFGFEIPTSLVMNNLAPLSTIPGAETKIAKPLNGGDHTRNVAELRDDAESLRLGPPMFIQELIAGENLRLFSVGGNLSCFHLATSMLDYREDRSTEIAQVDIPDSIIEPARRLIERKRFDYCALDFRCRNGFENPVFLEINSFPMFVRFDDAGELCIVNAILDYLTTN